MTAPTKTIQTAVTAFPMESTVAIARVPTGPSVGAANVGQHRIPMHIQTAFPRDTRSGICSRRIRKLGFRLSMCIVR